MLPKIMETSTEWILVLLILEIQTLVCIWWSWLNCLDHPPFCSRMVFPNDYYGAQLEVRWARELHYIVYEAVEILERFYRSQMKWYTVDCRKDREGMTVDMNILVDDLLTRVFDMEDEADVTEWEPTFPKDNNNNSRSWVFHPHRGDYLKAARLLVRELAVIVKKDRALDGQLQQRLQLCPRIYRGVEHLQQTKDVWTPKEKSV